MNTDKNNAFDALRHCASTSDLQQLPVVAEALSTYLRTQDIDFSFCGINAFRHTGKTWLASKFVAAFDGRVTTYIDQPISATKLLSIWLLDQVFYRPDLEDSDILRETERLRSHFAQPVRCVLDISFAYGTLAINSTKAHAFSEENINTLRQVVPLFDDLFARFESFEPLQQGLHNSGHSHYQRALLHVRNAVWRMQSINETYILLDALTQAMREVKIPFADCGINVVIADEGQPKTLFYDRENTTWRDGTPTHGSDSVLHFWQSGETTYRPDLEREDLYGERTHISTFFAEAIRSVIDIPFSRGTLAVNSALANAFDGETIGFLEEMTSIMDKGFRRLHDLDLLTRHVREAEAMTKAIAAVAETDQLDEVLQTVVTQTAEILDSECVTLFLYDEDSQTLIPRAQLGHDWEALSQVRQRPGEGISGRVFVSGEPLLIRDLTQREYLEQLDPANRAHYANAFLQPTGSHAIAVPLRIDQRTIGTLSVGGKGTPYSERDLERLETLAAQASFALYRADQQKKLSDSETQYRQLIERAPSPILVYAQGRFLFLNPAAVRTLGGESAEQFIGHPIMDFVATGHRWSLLRHMAAINSGRGKNSSLVERFLRLNGEEVDIEITGYPIDFMRQPAVQVTFRDITAQVRAEQMLKLNLALQRVRNEVLMMENEESWHQVASSIHGELRQLISFNQCGFILVDLKNDAFDAYLIEETGVKKREHKGIPASLRHVVETNQVLYRATRKEIARFGDKVGPKGGCIVDVPFLGGTLAINHTRENAFTDEDIDILEQFAQVLSEAYRRLEDLQQMQEQTMRLNQRQKMEAIGELSGGLAHDFNNMLTAILTTCDLMMVGRSEDDRDREDLNLIKRAGQQAAALTRQLLAFSRRQVVQPQRIDLNRVLSESHQMLRRLIGEHIELSTVLDTDHCCVYMDLNQMEQIVINLAINARDAMPSGGVLSIEARQVTIAAGQIDMPAGDYALLRVQDEGCGMSAEVRERLFEPFFTTKDTGSGTGMGLAIVYGAVQQNNGYIRVHSAPGEGALFEIWFPLVASVENETTSPLVEQKASGGTESILLVEDEEIVRRATSRVLQTGGYSVVVAENAEEALRLREDGNDPVDLVISDVVMPGMSGEKLAVQLNEVDPQLRVLLISGYTDDARVQGFPFLAKPFTPEELLRKVRKVLDD